MSKPGYPGFEFSPQHDGLFHNVGIRQLIFSRAYSGLFQTHRRRTEPGALGFYHTKPGVVIWLVLPLIRSS